MSQSDYRAREQYLATLIILVGAGLRVLGLAHLPPGLFYDESANGVDALRVLEGVRPIFFSGNQGREPLFIYLQALSLALFGPSPLALRLPAAALGIATIAATYSLFRVLFNGRVALIAEALTAVSFWHVSLSRLAFSAVAVPFVSALAVFWAWRAVQARRLSHFALAGFFLAVDLYTYIPARLVPVLFLGAALIALARSGRSGLVKQKQSWRGGLLATVCFSAAAFPLAYYAFQHPDIVFGRVLALHRVEPTGSAVQSGAAGLAALVWSGDPNPRHGLPGKPLIDPIATLGVGLGSILVLRQRDCPAGLFTLGWCAAMLLPAVLSPEPAHALRLAGELPFILGLSAVGLDAAARKCSARWPPASAVLPALAAALISLFTAHDYFGIWAHRRDTFDAFQSSALDALRLLDRRPAGTPVFVTAGVYEGVPIPLVFSPGAARSARVFDGRADFVVPAASSPVFYLYTADYRPDGQPPEFDRLSVVAVARDPFGRLEGELRRLDPPLEPPAPERTASAFIGSAIHITGFDLSPVVAPGQMLGFAVHWTVVGTLPSGSWQFFAHLVDRHDHRVIAEAYDDGYPPSAWRRGDRVITRFQLSIASEEPPAVCDVDVGVFDRQTGRRLPVSDPSGRLAGTAFAAGPVRIDRPTPAPPPTYPLAVEFQPAIRLIGYDLTQGADGALIVRLHWLTDRPIDREYTVFVHLLDRTGRFLSGADSEPAGGDMPTSTWKPGEVVLDPHTFPAGRPGGAAYLEVGLYVPATGQRVPLRSPGAAAGDSVRLPL